MCSGCKATELYVLDLEKAFACKYHCRKQKVNILVEVLGKWMATVGYCGLFTMKMNRESITVV